MLTRPICYPPPQPMVRRATDIPFAQDILQPLIRALFLNGEVGAVYVSHLYRQVLYQDDLGSAPVVAGGNPVQRHEAVNAPLHATSHAADQTYNRDGAVGYIDHTAGSLSVSLPDLGANATRIVVTWRGVEHLSSQAISGVTILPQEQYEAVIYIDRALAANEIAEIERVLASTWLLADSAWDDAGRWRDIAIWEDAA